VVFSLFASLRYYLVTWLGERVVADIRNAVYARVIRMDPAFFEVTRTGEVLSRLTTDTTLVQSISGAGLSIALRSTLSLIGGLVMLVLTSPRMAGYTMVGIVIVVVPVIVVGRYIRRLSRQSQDRVATPAGWRGGAQRDADRTVVRWRTAAAALRRRRKSFLVAWRIA
jgi:ATP-binding cassette subfamily B protein